jgi:hypothetical protein
VLGQDDLCPGTIEMGPDVSGGTEVELTVEGEKPSETAPIESTAPEEAESTDAESEPTAEADESPGKEAE